MKNGKTEKNVKNSRFCQFWAQISGPQIFLRHEVGGSKLKLQSKSNGEGGLMTLSSMDQKRPYSPPYGASQSKTFSLQKIICLRENIL